MTDITAEKAINFLRECQPDQPWCLSLSFNAPHAQDDDPRLYIWPQSEDKLYENDIIPEAINSGTAFFVGYDDHYRQSDHIDEERYFTTDLRRTNRAIFTKLQYLFRY